MYMYIIYKKKEERRKKLLTNPIIVSLQHFQQIVFIYLPLSFAVKSDFVLIQQMKYDCAYTVSTNIKQNQFTSHTKLIEESKTENCK